MLEEIIKEFLEDKKARKLKSRKETEIELEKITTLTEEEKEFAENYVEVLRVLQVFMIDIKKIIDYILFLTKSLQEREKREVLNYARAFISKETIRTALKLKELLEEE